MNQEIGECCFCKGECNPLSQSCGQCMRETNMYRLGWKRGSPKYSYIPKKYKAPNHSKNRK